MIDPPSAAQRAVANAPARAPLWSLLVAALCFLAGAGRPALQEEGAGAPPRVLVVPIHTHIDARVKYMIQSALREAEAVGAPHVVLDIDSPGGEVVASQDIEDVLSKLSGTDIRVTAFVRRRAQSAGAYIALACADIYMAPGSSIGAIVPVMAGPGGIQAIPDPEVRNKLVAALRGEVRAMVERRIAAGKGNLRPGAEKLAEAMVDPDIEVFEVTYVDAGGVQVTAILDRGELTELQDRGVEILERSALDSRPLVLTAGEAQRLGLSSGSPASIEELVRDEFRLPPETIRYRQETWSENAVAFLDGMKPLLFVIGFLLLILELKTPGFAVPGVLGLAFLALAMFGSYLIGLAEWTEILLFFLGIGLIIVEVFVLPGMLIFGFAGLLSLIAGLVLSQQTFFLPANTTQERILLDNLVNMLLLTIGVIATSFLLSKLTPYIPVFNRVLQPPPDVSYTGAGLDRVVAASGRRDALVGRVGMAGTDLRPVGLMELDGDQLDVISSGSYVPAGTPVRVVSVELNQVVVEPVEEPGEEAARRASEGGETSYALLIFLWVLGLCFVIAEVFFPSFGVLAVMAALSFVASIFLAYSKSIVAGHVFLTMAALAVPVCAYLALKYLPHTPMGRSLLLAGPDPEDVSGSGEQPGLSRYLHRRGRALSDLRPSGIARIDGDRVDVVTRGEMLPKDSPVIVLKVEGNRVIVGLDVED